MDNLWEKIGNECLNKANKILQERTALDTEDARTVRELVDIAIAIDVLNLRWAEQKHYGTGVPLRNSESFYKENGIKQSFA